MGSSPVANIVKPIAKPIQAIAKPIQQALKPVTNAIPILKPVVNTVLPTVIAGPVGTVTSIAKPVDSAIASTINKPGEALLAVGTGGLSKVEPVRNAMNGFVDDLGHFGVGFGETAVRLTEDVLHATQISKIPGAFKEVFSGLQEADSGINSILGIPGDFKREQELNKLRAGSTASPTVSGQSTTGAALPNNLSDVDEEARGRASMMLSGGSGSGILDRPYTRKSLLGV